MPNNRQAVNRLAARIGVPSVFIAAGLLSGLGYGLVKPPSYSASAHVIVVAQSADAGPAATSFAQAYGRLASLPATLAWASPALPPSVVEDARSHIQASTSPETPLIRITGQARTAEQAARYANAAASAVVSYGKAHEQDTRVKVAAMSPATEPASPSSPNLLLSVLVGTATGVLLAVLAMVSGVSVRPGGRRRRPAPATGHDTDCQQSGSADESAAQKAGDRTPAGRRREPATAGIGAAAVGAAQGAGRPQGGGARKSKAKPAEAGE
ncbi:hypothetical protein [Actinomadura hibisca]|uniref:hypothetical protein n=1 Tax=Actinomadura hibisca TaxID=68565 RepID=UPI00082B1BF8|nr:hypothetical protein [Actinomadura hibisca]